MSQCTGNNSIAYQQWNNISGSAVTNLTSSSLYPNNPSLTGTRTLFEMPQNIGNNIGIRMNGFLCAPTTGTYYFWISADASAELWLSTSSNVADRRRIALLTRNSNYRQWNRYSTQKSAAISLVA